VSEKPQRSFTGGEFDPKLWARTDTSKYQTAVRTCRNFEIMPQGGVRNRAGTLWVNAPVLETLTPAQLNASIVAGTAESYFPRYLPFVFDDDDAYALEFSDSALRFVRGGAPLDIVDETIAAWVTATDYLVGDLVMNGVVYYYCKVAHESSAADEPGTGASWNASWHALTGTIFEIPSPYDINDVRQLDYAQSADVMTLTHRSYPIYELRRYGEFRWTLEPAVIASGIEAPLNLVLSGGNSGTIRYYAVTAIREETYEESLSSVAEGAINRVPSVEVATLLTFDSVVGAIDYNVYRSTDGTTFGLVGRAARGLPEAAEAGGASWLDSATSITTATINTWVANTSTPAEIEVLDSAAVPNDKAVDSKYTVKGRSRASHTVSSGFAITYTRAKVHYSRDGEPYVLAGTFNFDDFSGAISGNSGWRNEDMEITVPDNGYVALNIKIVPEVKRSSVGGTNATHELDFTSDPQDEVNWTRQSDALGFQDFDYTADYTIAPPVARQVFDTPSNYPGVTHFYRQRRVFANSVNQPENLWASRAGGHGTFVISTPIKDDDANVFALAGERVNEVRALLDLDKLIIFTAEAEYTTPTLIPGGVDTRRISRNGIQPHLKPQIFDKSTLYVQSGGRRIRELFFNDLDTAQSADLTVMAEHLFPQDIVAVAAQRKTNIPVLWAVRRDGILLGLTYLREHEVWGWHRHDTPSVNGLGTGTGFIFDACVIPEDGVDTLYLAVARRVDLVSDYSLSFERVANRAEADIDLDNEATALRGVFSDMSFVVGVSPGVEWAADEVTGLDVLEGFAVCVAAGGIVVHSPYHPDTITPRVVTGGAIDVSAEEYALATDNDGVMVIGLPYTSDLLTLDIDRADARNRKLLVNKAMVVLDSSRSVFVGTRLPADLAAVDDLYEERLLDEDGYDDDRFVLNTGQLEIQLDADWDTNGRVAIRHIDPQPCTILSITPQGHLHRS
jgi:hypothetical protein